MTALPKVSPYLAGALTLAALEVLKAPRTGRKRWEAESWLGEVLVAINGVPLGFQGPLNPDGEPYPLRLPDGSPDLGRYTADVLSRYPEPDPVLTLPEALARYSDVLNAAEIAPTGDDFNALLDLAEAADEDRPAVLERLLREALEVAR